MEPQLHYRSEATAEISSQELSPAVAKIGAVKSECTSPPNVNIVIQSNSENALTTNSAWSSLAEDTWSCTPSSTPSTSVSSPPFLVSSGNNANQQDDSANLDSSATSPFPDTMVSEVTDYCQSYSPSRAPCAVGEDVMQTSSENEGPLSPTYELQHRPTSRSLQELCSDGKNLNGISNRNTLLKSEVTSLAFSPSTYVDVPIKPSIPSPNVATARRPEALTQTKPLTLSSLLNQADHSVARKMFIPVQKAYDCEPLLTQKRPHKHDLNEELKTCFVHLSSPDESVSVGELPEKEKCEPRLDVLPQNQFVRYNVCSAQERGTKARAQKEISFPSPVVSSVRSSAGGCDNGNVLGRSPQGSNDPLVRITSNSILQRSTHGLPCSANSKLPSLAFHHSYFSAHKTAGEAKPTTGVQVNRNSSLHTLLTNQSRNDLQSSHSSTGETAPKTREPVDRNETPDSIPTSSNYPVICKKAMEPSSGYPVSGTSDSASPYNSVTPCTASNTPSATSEQREPPETIKSRSFRYKISGGKKSMKRFYPLRSPVSNNAIYNLVAQLNEAISKPSKECHKTHNNPLTSNNPPTALNTKTVTTSMNSSHSSTTAESNAEPIETGYTDEGIVITKHAETKFLRSQGSQTNSEQNPKISGKMVVQKATETTQVIPTLTEVIHLNQTADKTLSRNRQNRTLPEYSTIVCSLDEPEVQSNGQTTVSEIETLVGTTTSPGLSVHNLRGPSMSDQSMNLKQTRISGIHTDIEQTEKLCGQIRLKSNANQTMTLQSREMEIVPTTNLHCEHLENKDGFKETVPTTVTAIETNKIGGGIPTTETVQTALLQSCEMIFDSESKKLDTKSISYNPSVVCSDKIEYEAKQTAASCSSTMSRDASLVLQTPPNACSSRDTAEMLHEFGKPKESDKTLNIQKYVTTPAAKTNRTKGQSEEAPSNNYLELSNYPIITVHYKPERLPPLIVNGDESLKKLSLRNKNFLRKRMQNCKLPRYLRKTARRRAPSSSGIEGPPAEKQIRLAIPTAKVIRHYPLNRGTQPLSNEKNSSSANGTQNTCNKYLPKPTIFAIPKENGATLKWSIEELNETFSIESYEVFSYQSAKEDRSVPSIDMLWNKIGVFEALELPMQCTVTNMRRQSRYHFMVRAVDCSDRAGPFSQHCTVLTC